MHPIVVVFFGGGVPAPPFVPVVRDVTDDPKYANLAVSQTDYGPMDPNLPGGALLRWAGLLGLGFAYS